MITNFFADRILAELCGKYNYMSVYIGLSRTEPTVDGTNILEPSGNGYERVVLGSSSQVQHMGNVTDGSVTNNSIIHFPEATGEWGVCTHFCLFDAKTNGNLLAYGELTQAIAPTINTVPLVRVGELTISVTINTTDTAVVSE